MVNGKQFQDGLLVVLLWESDLDGTTQSQEVSLQGSQVEETSLRFDVPITSMPGVYGLRLVNPNEQEAVASAQLVIVDAAHLEELAPEVVGTSSQTITLRGSNFYVSTEQPSVIVGDQTLPTSNSDCRALPAPADGIERCSTLTFEISTSTSASTSSVTVDNGLGCNSEESLLLHRMPDPVLTGITPQAICELPTTLSLTGDLLTIDGQQPTVTFAENGNVLYSTTATASDCLVGPTDSVRRCTTLTVELPQDFPSARRTIDVRATNPDPVGGSAHLQLEQYQAPVLTLVDPVQFCLGGGSFTITGRSLYDDSRVLLHPAGGGAPIEAASVQANVEHTELVANFGVTPSGDFSLAVENPGGCSTTHNVTISVELGPMGLFVDPPTSYAAIDTQITIYVTDLDTGDRPVSVFLQPSAGGNDIPLASVDDSELDRIRATVPANTSAGTYHVVLGGAGGDCSRVTLPDAFEVVDQPDLNIVAITPSFGATSASTPITIEGDTTGGGFVSTPRVYLNPAFVGGTPLALMSVVFLDNTTLTALVPAGLSTGDYDIIVVNPDGAVGVTDVTERFTVVSNPPPRIDSISPGSVLNLAARSLTINGEHFRAPVVELLCEENSTATSSITVTETSATPTVYEGTFDASVLSDRAVCIVRLTNSDGTYDLFSSLVVTGLDQKLFDFAAGPDLQVARRGLSASAGRVSNAARYVYAIGGDDGTTTLDSVEAAAVDIHGEASAFKVLQYRMMTARTHHNTVRVGRFIYAFGGTNDGSTALASVERAYILPPSERPTMSGLDLSVDDTSGVDHGTWYYKVSAVMSANDDYNPGGESLPSEAVVARLPNLGSYRIRAHLFWTAVSGAVGYRIYRTPTGVEHAGQERLLAEVAGTTYTDAGGSTGTERSLEVGALGKWHAPVDAGGTSLIMAEGRFGAGVVHALNPGGTTFHIYVFAGNNGTNLSRSYQMCSISTSGSQEVIQSFQVGTEELSTRRSMIGAYRAGPDNASHVTIVPNQNDLHLIYVGGGFGTNGSVVNNLDWSEINWPSGQLSSFTSFSGSQRMQNQAGYGALLINNFLYAFGGKSGVADTINHQTLICDGVRQGCSGDYAPEIRNWSNTSANLLTPRIYAGVALESAFIYLLGGDAGGTATRSTEMTIW